jgi:hypothetical protein
LKEWHSGARFEVSEGSENMAQNVAEPTIGHHRL